METWFKWEHFHHEPSHCVSQAHTDHFLGSLKLKGELWLCNESIWQMRKERFPGLVWASTYHQL